MLKIRHALRYGLVGPTAMLVPALGAPGRAPTDTVYVEIARAGFIVSVGGGKERSCFRAGDIRCASAA